MCSDGPHHTQRGTNHVGNGPSNNERAPRHTLLSTERNTVHSVPPKRGTQDRLRPLVMAAHTQKHVMVQHQDLLPHRQGGIALCLMSGGGVLALLTRDPMARLGAKGVDQVKAHPWFHLSPKIDWRSLLDKSAQPPWLPNPADGPFFEEQPVRIGSLHS